MSSIQKIQQNVSRETFSRLEAYVALLEKWNRTINLIGKTTIDDIWSRHIDDSIQLLSLIPSNTKNIADIGSGGGLPGLVLACCLPKTPITLIEKDQRKSAFLTHAAHALGLKSVKIEARSVAEMSETFTLITARALASLDELCAMAYPLCAQGAICLFPKGENFATELEKAEGQWRFKHQLHTSRTNEKSCIISITELKPRIQEGNA